jgi:hypothetical protein
MIMLTRDAKKNKIRGEERTFQEFWSVIIYSLKILKESRYLLCLKVEYDPEEFSLKCQYKDYTRKYYSETKLCVGAKYRKKLKQQMVILTAVNKVQT